LRTTKIQVLVPHQKDFPLQFVAAVTYTKDGATRSVIWAFTQEKDGESWRAVHQAALEEGSTPPSFKVGSDGYAERLEPSQATEAALRIDRVAIEYSSEITPGEKSFGHFAAGPNTTEASKAFADEIAGSKKNGVDARINVSVTGDGTYAYRLSDGGAWVFFGCQIETVLTGSGKTPLTFTEKGDGVLTPETPNIYGKYTRTDVLLLGAIDPAAGTSDAKVKVVGAYLGPVAATWK
jgi:hypothetical protein